MKKINNYIEMFVILGADYENAFMLALELMEV